MTNNNNIMGMWGATDLNDLIRGLKMVLAQAEDVRACGGTLADMQSIGTCGTCSMRDPILCEDAPEDCHECDGWDDVNSVMCDYGQDAATCKGYPHSCCECDEKFYEEDKENWNNEEDNNDWDYREDWDNEEEEKENEWYHAIDNLAEIMTLWSDGEDADILCDWQDEHETSIEQLMVEVFEGMGYSIDLNKARKKYRKNHS